MARRRRDRWALGPAFSLPETARGGPDYDVVPPDPVLAWVQFSDRILELEARAIAYTDRAVLVEWGFGQGADCAWVWRDAVGLHPTSVADGSIEHMSLPIAPVSEALLDLHHIEASGADEEANTRTMHSITDRLMELGAMSATFNDETDELTLEVTPLLVAIATNQMFLIQQIAELRGVSEEAVRFEVREFLQFRDENS